MKYKTIILLATLAGFTGPAMADRTLLVNTDFSSDTEWITGSNSFIGGAWQAFIQDGYTLFDRISAEGSGFVFTSWDDGNSDTLETYVFQEFGAGPAGGGTPSEFQAGEVIVFKGRARSTKSDTDVVARAFIKTLGYNELGWAFQLKPAQSAFFEVPADLTEFELSVTFPDLAVDDSFQVLQIGFELTTSFGGGVMDSGTIYFENIEAYVEGEGGTTWLGYAVDANGWADTGEWMGWVNVTDAPWVISSSLDGWMYVPEQSAEAGAWVYIFR